MSVMIKIFYLNIAGHELFDLIGYLPNLELWIMD